MNKSRVMSEHEMPFMLDDLKYNSPLAQKEISRDQGFQNFQNELSQFEQFLNPDYRNEKIDCNFKPFNP
jgi:hypothetical protein